MATNIYSNGLDRCEANYAPLTPIDFLLRAASVYPDQVALIDGQESLTWSEVAARCQKLDSSLRKQGIDKNDTVAIIAPNSQAIYEAHFGVPMAGAVLNTINTRLDADAIAFILGHGEAKVLFVDAELADLVSQSLAKLEPNVRNQLLVVDIEVDGLSGGVTGESSGSPCASRAS